MGNCGQPRKKEGDGILAARFQVSLVESGEYILTDFVKSKAMPIKLSEGIHLQKYGMLACYPYMYLIGGLALSSERIERSVFRGEFHFYSLQVIMEPLSDLLLPRYYPYLVHREKTKEIVCVGGATERDMLMKDCEIYNIQKNVWTILPSLNRPQEAAIEMQDKLYAFSSLGPSCAYEILDLTAHKSWIPQKIISADFSFKLQHFGLMEYNKHIVILGGTISDPTEDFEELIYHDGSYLFSPTTSTLKKSKELGLPEAASFLSPGAGCASSSFGFSIYSSKDVVFQFIKNKWTAEPLLPNDREVSPILLQFLH